MAPSENVSPGPAVALHGPNITTTTAAITITATTTTTTTITTTDRVVGAKLRTS